MDACMNQLVTIDQNYISPLIVMLDSYQEFHKNIVTNIYIVHSSLEQNIQRLIMGDQDLVNILMEDNMLLLDERIYNLDERTYKYYNFTQGFVLSDVVEQTAIIHYNTKYKPWLEGYVGVLDQFYPYVSEKGTLSKGVMRGQIKSVLNIIKAAD